MPKFNFSSSYLTDHLPAPHKTQTFHQLKTKWTWNVHTHVRTCLYVCVHACAYAHMCVRAWVCVTVHVHARACTYLSNPFSVEA